MESSPTVLAVLDDLMFTVKIHDAAQRAGIAIQFLESEKDVLEKATTQPAMIILDLNYGGVDTLGLVGKLKSNEQTKSVQLLGYLSHVQGDLKVQAQQAGCDMVLPRSAFSQNLPQIMQRLS